MKDRPLPELPFYENAVIARKWFSAITVYDFMIT